MRKSMSGKILCVFLAVLFLVGCQTEVPVGTPTGTLGQTVSGTLASDPAPTPSDENTDREVRLLNGTPIENFTIVYDKDEPDYNYRAAEYIQTEVLARTGHRLAIKEDNEQESTHEIIVGETSRQLSRVLDADIHSTQFAITSNDKKIAMEGDYFVIAAAAYFFVETYVPQGYFDSVIPQKTVIHEPIQKEAKNFILLIGDGMGVYQTLLYDIYNAPTTGTYAYSDGEDQFYGYLLPNRGYARTNSLSGVTDSAAAGTALATGYKTTNNYVGKNSAGKNLKSLTELAASLGKATAVMSTEPSTGATPASFSAHTTNRNNSSEILASQSTLVQNHGTLIRCDYNVYDVRGVRRIENTVVETLTALSKDEDGFFLMYEEAHIDKHCHSNDIQQTFNALMRFNQVIGRFMEYAFYHPDTFVLITADHETGGLLPNGSGTFSYSHGNHSAQFVPVFAYGMGAEMFADRVIENTQIPKTYADMMGSQGFGDPHQPPSLVP